MEFKEILKAQSLTDEQINNITAKMKEEKIIYYIFRKCRRKIYKVKRPKG